MRARGFCCLYGFKLPVFLSFLCERQAEVKTEVLASIYFRPAYQFVTLAFLSIIVQLLKIVQLVKNGHRQSKPRILTPVEGMATVQVRHAVSDC